MKNVSVMILIFQFPRTHAPCSRSVSVSWWSGETWTQWCDHSGWSGASSSSSAQDEDAGPSQSSSLCSQRRRPRSRRTARSTTTGSWHWPRLLPGAKQCQQWCSTGETPTSWSQHCQHQQEQIRQRELDHHHKHYRDHPNKHCRDHQLLCTNLHQCHHNV